MIVTGTLRHVKTVEIPKEGGGMKRLLQLFFDEDTLRQKNFHAVFVSQASSEFLSAYTLGKELYAEVAIYSIVQKESQSGRVFTNYFGEIKDWKVIA